LHWPAHEQWRWKELCESVTHLIIFSLEVKPNGDFAALDRFPSKSHLANAVEAATSTGTILGLSKLTSHPGTKLLLCFGGYSRTNGFPQMVANTATRKRFIDKLV
jgi:GH18 family chitinase